MTDSFDYIDNWFWDYNDRCWKVKLLNEKIIQPGDRVLIKFSNGNFTGTVKQVAGFGSNEDRAVISVLFPGRSKGKKIHITNVLDKV